MKVTVTAFLGAKRNMDVTAGHGAKLGINQVLYTV
jgi:hypothetical protein